MGWTEIARRHYRREGLRYESDTTDAEWFVMEPRLPPACGGTRRNSRRVPRRPPGCARHRRIKADDRRPCLHRPVLQLGDLERVGLGERTTEYRKVLGEDEVLRPLTGPQPVTTPSPSTLVFSMPNSTERCSTNMSNSSNKSCRATARCARERSDCPLHAASRCASRRRPIWRPHGGL
jgi:hypothetical protein